MSAQVGESNQVLGGDGDKYEVGLKLGGRRKRSSDEESSLVATKSLKARPPSVPLLLLLKPNDEEEIEASIKESLALEDTRPNEINSKLPPELLSAIFRFLPFSDLKNALLVCR